MCKTCIPRAELHCHTDASNLKLPDSINKVDQLIEAAYKKGARSLAITDHECVSNHVKAYSAVKKLKDKGKISEDFKLILGNEIYLVDKLEDVRDNYQSGKTKFPHYLLLAKNKKGHEAIRVLSSRAWKNSFMTGLMQRTPTEKEFFEDVIKRYPDSIVATSACLGSESSIHILAADEAKRNGDEELMKYHQQKTLDFIEWNISVHGKENFYLELQPSADYEQKLVNETLVKLAKHYGLEVVITSDVHYIDKSKQAIHSAFLNSKEDDTDTRETEKFYSHTYLHEQDEIFDKLSYLDEDIVVRALENTMKIANQIEEYELEAPTRIPCIKIPEFNDRHYFKKYYDKCEYIKKMAYSNNEQDRYFLHLVENGFEKYIVPQTLSPEKFNEYLERIDIELKQLWIISERENQSMASYYVTVSSIVSMIWGDDCGDESRYTGSFLNAGRGSAVAFLVCYLADITQIDPISEHYASDTGRVVIEWWRHLNSSKNLSSLDIDLDVNGNKIEYILNRMKDEFGREHDNVIQVATFTKVKSKSAILTAARGLGIDKDNAAYVASFIPTIRGEQWSIRDCLYGNEDLQREKITQFVNEIEKYPLLKETALEIEGVISAKSIHAGGIIVTSMGERFVEDGNGSVMVTPHGIHTTAYDLDDSQSVSQIKYDLLKTDITTKNQTAMEFLLDDGAIEWQGNLRKTYNKYLHPEAYNPNDKRIYELIAKQNIPDMFQFSTQLAQSAIQKVKPSNFVELMSVNSIIRLMVDGDEEQPIDTFIRYKNNPEEAYKDMRELGLNEDEIKIFERHLKHLNFVADSQESVMMLAIDPEVGASDLKVAEILRRGIAKKSRDKTMKAMNMIRENASKAGIRDVVVDFLWLQVKRQILYSFSSPHLSGYTSTSSLGLYINVEYSPLYWNAAVLAVNSSSSDENKTSKSKATNYGKVANGISMITSHGTKVSLPSINRSTFGFKPDIERDQILYGLKGIVGINDDVVKSIIQNRPYKSFKDFHERIYKTKLIQTSHMIKLIKAGCFDEFDNRVNIMRHFLASEVDKKEKLTMGNLKRCVEYDCIDHEQFKHQLEMYNFDQYYKKLKKKTVAKPKDTLYYLPKIDTDFCFKHYSEDTIVDSEGEFYIVSHKLYDKEYKAHMEVLKEWLATSEAARQYNIAQFNELWNKHADGSVAKWEMQSVSYYAANHELENVDRNMYGVSNFFELSPEPIVTSTRKAKNRTYENYEVFTLMGTVLDKNKDKHSFTLLTPEGVVTCKTYSGAFSNYDRTISRQLGNGKKETVEKSWFTRGNLLMVRGFRRDDQFVLRTYGSRDDKQSTISMITNVYEDGTLGIKSKREKV